MTSVAEECEEKEASECESENFRISLEKKEFELEEKEKEVLDLRRRLELAIKDKESMVVKYAVGEKDVILARKAKEDANKKIKSLLKEKEDLNSKIKSVSAERSRLQQLCDSRYQDLTISKKDLDIWKEEVKCQESKASNAAGRLKAEVDAHRETREQLDITIKHLAETRAEIESTRKECQDFMQRYRDEEKHKKDAERAQSVKLMIDEAAASELVSLKEKYKLALEENHSLKLKIQSLEAQRIQCEATVGQLKETVNSQKSQIGDLLSQVAENEDLKNRIEIEIEKRETCGAEAENLRQEIEEIREDMSSCRAKEAEMLRFTQNLTEKNVSLLSSLASLEASSSAVEVKYTELLESVSLLENDLFEVRTELQSECVKRREDTEALAKKLAEKSKVVENYNQRIADSENEISVLKRKHASKLKELTRELQSSKKRAEVANGSTTSEVLSSRTSSSSSLNKLSGDDTSTSKTLMVPENGVVPRKLSGSSQHSNVLNDEPDYSLAQVPDSQVLIEKIIKLQRNLARKHEKQEFMGEHIEALQKEIKKKNKVIQNYVLKQEPGALASTDMDENKRKISEHGGIMASLYSSRQSDTNMTLDLSLEINRKLQAVLEDTLLKNITLKENINTLGNEIANISTIQGKL